jgi:hypothetical protein
MKNILLSIFLVAGVLLTAPASGWSESQPKGNPPVITASFAVERGYYGSIWKIYLEAEDPDGDMSRIAVEVDQIGYGHYPVDWTIIKAPFKKQLRGYLQWNTFSSKASYLREWTHITVRVSIVDRAGNWSNEVSFPFEFVSGRNRKINPPAPFDRENLPRLGHILIDLYEPTLMGADSRRED